MIFSLLAQGVIYFQLEKAMEASDGETYESGQSRDVLYEAGGMTIDYAYEDIGIPAPYIFELRDTVSQARQNELILSLG